MNLKYIYILNIIVMSVFLLSGCKMTGAESFDGNTSAKSHSAGYEAYDCFSAVYQNHVVFRGERNDSSKCLFFINLDNNTHKTLVSWNDYDHVYYGKKVLAGSHMYFSVMLEKTSLNEETCYVNTEEAIVCLYDVDMETGSIDMVYQSDKGYGAHIIQGMLYDNNQIFMEFSLQTNSFEEMGLTEEEFYSNYEKLFDQRVKLQGIKDFSVVYNLSTKKCEVYNLMYDGREFAADCLSDNKLYTVDSDANKIKTYDLQSGEISTLRDDLEVDSLYQCIDFIIIKLLSSSSGNSTEYMIMKNKESGNSFVMLKAFLPLLTPVILFSILILTTYIIIRHKNSKNIISVNFILLMFALSLVSLVMGLGITLEQVNNPLCINIFLLIWIAGSSICFFRFIYREYCFRKALSKEKKSDNPVLYEVLEKVSGGKSRYIKISETSLVNSPLVFGLIRPTICFPKISFTDKEIYYFLSHEWNHIIHRDVLIKYVIKILCIVYWWNPLVYILKNEIDITLEIISDSNATYLMKDEEKLDYLKALTHLARIIKSEKKGLTPAGIASATDSGKTTLEKRFQYLLSHHSLEKTQKLSKYIFIAFMCFLFVSSYFITIKAAESVSEPSDEVEYITITPDDDCFLVPNNGGNYTWYMNDNCLGQVTDIYAEPFSSMPIIQLEDLDKKMQQ